MSSTPRAAHHRPERTSAEQLQRRGTLAAHVLVQMPPEPVPPEPPVCDTRPCWEGPKDVSEGFRVMALPGLSRGILYPSRTARSLREAKTIFLGLGCPFVYLSRNNPRVASKILLPPCIAVRNVN